MGESRPLSWPRMGLASGSRLRLWLLAAACVCAWLALAEAASADSWCVHLVSDTTSCAAAPHETTDLQVALAQAGANPGPDSVQVSAVEFTSAPVPYSYTATDANRVTITGAGRNKTPLTSPNNPPGISVLSLDHGSVSGVRVVVP